MLGLGLVAFGMAAADRPLTAGGAAIGLLLLACWVAIRYAVSVALMSAGIGGVSSEWMDGLVAVVAVTLASAGWRRARRSYTGASA